VLATNFLKVFCHPSQEMVILWIGTMSCARYDQWLGAARDILAHLKIVTKNNCSNVPHLIESTKVKSLNNPKIQSLNCWRCCQTVVVAEPHPTV
jgi:hypothetical protein